MSRLPKRARGQRENTGSDSSPAPTAEGPGNGGMTPLAAVNTVETVKDVPGPQNSPSYATDFGYVFHDYDIMLPNDNRVQLLARIMSYEPRGIHLVGSEAGVPLPELGYGRIDHFYDTLYEELLKKAVIRDGYRHLPDTMDSGIRPDAPFALWVGEVNNVRVVKAFIDSQSWNDATQSMASAFSRKNRRATEDWETLMTFQIPDLYRMHALLHPPLSDRPNGCVTLTLVNNRKWFDALGTVNASHPCCLDWASNDLSFTSNDIDDILCEAEAAIAILRNELFIKALDNDAGGGFTYGTAGRGVRLDLKYFFTLIHELVYPSGLPEPGGFLIDPGEYNQVLYGDAIYGVDVTKTLGVATAWHLVGYPFVNGAPNGMVYRRGFNQLSPIVYAGMKEVWAVGDQGSELDTAVLYGNFAQLAPLTDSKRVFSSNAYKAWSRSGNAVPIVLPYETDSIVNFDDATSIRHWMEDGGPQSDHQWNEMLFARLDTFITHGPAGMKSYGLHQLSETVSELLRSAGCASWNLPFIR
jgi:hypothetical protein